MGGPGAPETSGAQPENVDLNLDKAANSLSDLKSTIETGGDTGALMVSLIDIAVEGKNVEGQRQGGLKEDLREAQIPENEWPALIAEFKGKGAVEVSKMQEVKAGEEKAVIESSEALALESFFLNIKNFPLIEAAIQARQPLPTFGPIATKVEEMIATIEKIPGMDTGLGTPKGRAEIYKFFKWIAEKLDIDTSNWVENKEPVVAQTAETGPESLENMDVLKLFGIALDPNGGEQMNKAVDLMSEKFDNFGPIDIKQTGSVIEMQVKDEETDKESDFKIGKDSISGSFYVKKFVGGVQEGDVKGKVFNGKLDDLIVKMKEMNRPAVG